MPVPSNKIFLNIAPSKHQGAILCLLRTYLSHFQLNEAKSLEEADFQLGHGIELSTSSALHTPSVCVPIDHNNLVPKSLILEGNPFPAPQVLELLESNFSFELNFDLFSFCCWSFCCK